MILKKHILLFICSFFILSLNAQTKKTNEEGLTRILFVFDGSQSMYGRWDSGQKIDIARRLMSEMLDSLQSLNSNSFQLALRVYGHQKPVPPQDCNDTRLEVGFGFNNIPKIKKVLRGIKPKGTTPIARSLSRAANDFGDCENCRNIIILITDGVESCDEDPCAASRQLQKKGIALKPFVIGIGLDEEYKNTFECVGNYYDASDEKTFENVLDIVISQALDNTSAQINLLDKNGLPSETDVPISFYDRTSGLLKKQIIHTLNYIGNPDTIYLDPLVTYDITIHSIPEVHIDSVRIAAGKHNMIGANLARGSLKLELPSNRTSYDDLKCIIRTKNGTEILHVQEFNTSQKYLQGNYNIEILSLPRFSKSNIRIKANETTSLSIPPPGTVNISSSSPGFGSILIERNNQLEWVIDLNSDSRNQSIKLQPGNYRVVFRSKTSQKSEYSVSKKFTVSSGNISIVKLN